MWHCVQKSSYATAVVIEWHCGHCRGSPVSLLARGTPSRCGYRRASDTVRSLPGRPAAICPEENIGANRCATADKTPVRTDREDSPSSSFGQGDAHTGTKCLKSLRSSESGCEKCNGVPRLRFGHPEHDTDGPPSPRRREVVTVALISW